MPEVDKNLADALRKACDIYEKIRTADELPSDEYAQEVADFLQWEFPEALLSAPKADSIGCIQAMSEKFEIHYYCNIVTGIILYVLSWNKRDPELKVGFEMVEDEDEPEPTIRDKLKS